MLAGHILLVIFKTIVAILLVQTKINMKTLLSVFFLIFAGQVIGATFIVTRSDDRNVACLSGLDCSFREAVNAANASPDDDIINFDGVGSPILVNGMVRIRIGDQIDIENAGALTINGLGANVLTIDGNSVNNGTQNGNRIFYINNATVTIRNVKLTGGYFNSAAFQGGGIFVNGGTLILERVHITNNQSGESGGGIFYSGGINHRLIQSTISNNTARSGGGGGFTLAGGTLYVANTTISSNNASIGNINSLGGGFNGSPILRNVTITMNGGSRYDNAFRGNPDMKNTLITGEQNQSIYPFPCTVTADNNLVGTCSAPLILGPLQYNGGSTPTYAPLPGSPAIDTGNNAFAVDPFDSSPLRTDQRGKGFPRFVDGNGDGGATVDIGAVEAPQPQAITFADVSLNTIDFSPQ